jgi:hypothetical protein
LKTWRVFHCLSNVQTQIYDILRYYVEQFDAVCCCCCCIVSILTKELPLELSSESQYYPLRIFIRLIPEFNRNMKTACCSNGRNLWATPQVRFSPFVFHSLLDMIILTFLAIRVVSSQTTRASGSRLSRHIGQYFVEFLLKHVACNVKCRLFLPPT